MKQSYSGGDETRVRISCMHLCGQWKCEKRHHHHISLYSPLFSGPIRLNSGAHGGTIADKAVIRDLHHPIPFHFI
jgi:hypothetical protein